MKPAPPAQDPPSDEGDQRGRMSRADSASRASSLTSNQDFPRQRSGGRRATFDPMVGKTRSDSEASISRSPLGGQLAFLRTRSNSQMSIRPGAGLVFQEPPADMGPGEFDLAVREELARLTELLRAELSGIRDGPAYGSVVGQLRIIANCNQEQVLDCITAVRLPTKAARNNLISYTRNAFLEQDLMIAMAGTDGSPSASFVEGSHNKWTWATFMGLRTLNAKPSKLYAEFVKLNSLWRVLTLAALFWILLNVSQEVHQPEVRCAVLIFTLLGVQLSGLVPNYCVGLLIPVLATALRVLPGKTIQETAKGCFGSMMNTMTAMVIGSFTINVIFMRCQLEVRFINFISQTFGSMPKVFLLVLMMGCMFVSAVTFVTLLALAAMMPAALADEGSSGKSLLLGVAISCTLGGALTPISGTTSLVAMSALSEYGLEVDFSDWMMISCPIMIMCCILTWLILLALFGTPPPVAGADDDDTHGIIHPLGFTQCMFLFLSVCFILGCALEDALTPVIGSAGNLGLMLTSLAYSSGFLNKADFLAMPWEVLMILFGVNVLSYSLKESGLALSLASRLAPAQVYDIDLWTDLGKITACMAVSSSFMGHAVLATIGIPIVVAIGAKLYAPMLTVMLAVAAIHVGVGSPFSSTDLLLTLETVNVDGQRPLLRKRDFFLAGGLVVVACWTFISTAGFHIGVFVLGRPPKPIIIKAPAELIPTGASRPASKDSNFTSAGGSPSRPGKIDGTVNATKGEKPIHRLGGKVEETPEQIRARRERDLAAGLPEQVGEPRPLRPFEEKLRREKEEQRERRQRQEEEDDGLEESGDQEQRPSTVQREIPGEAVARALHQQGRQRSRMRLRRVAERRRERQEEADREEERAATRRVPEAEEEVDLSR